jgi:hypothetical protein
MRRLIPALTLSLIVGALTLSTALADRPSGFDPNGQATGQVSDTGFDQFGYNNVARIFSGTGTSWALSKGLAGDLLGIYSPDKLVMKWNAEWDRGDADHWTKPPYSAWTDNEWNGKAVANGSGQIWHYKIVWVGNCGADYAPLSNGGYCIWGQFEVIMDQGMDPNVGPGHLFLALAKPAGYGAYSLP